MVSAVKTKDMDSDLPPPLEGEVDDMPPPLEEGEEEEEEEEGPPPLEIEAGAPAAPAAAAAAPGAAAEEPTMMDEMMRLAAEELTMTRACSIDTGPPLPTLCNTPRLYCALAYPCSAALS